MGMGISTVSIGPTCGPTRPATVAPFSCAGSVSHHAYTCGGLTGFPPTWGKRGGLARPPRTGQPTPSHVPLRARRTPPATTPSRIRLELGTWVQDIIVSWSDGKTDRNKLFRRSINLSPSHRVTTGCDLRVASKQESPEPSRISDIPP